MNNLLRTYINRMSRLAGVSITRRHLDILEFTYDFYRKNRVGPLYQNLKKHIGATKEEIDAIFPNGLNSVYTWVGIPIQTPDLGCKPITQIKVDDYREVYFDYNSTTPLRKEIIKALLDFFCEKRAYGNPSSGSALGERAYLIINDARTKIAELLKVKSRNIIFTSCGTESNNLAIKGLAFKRLNEKGKILTTKIEHPSVLNSLKYLQTLGFDIEYIDVLPDGIVDPNEIKRRIDKNVFLIAVMAVNNEIGTIQPIGEIGKIAKERNIPFFVDAVQAFGKIPLNPAELNISVMSISGHKIYAPKGIGAIYIEDNLKLSPLLHGGDQEFGLRAGTENVSYIAALGLAAQIAYAEMISENQRLFSIQKEFLNRLLAIEPNIIVNGSLDKRLPNNLNIGFPDIDGGSLLLSLNQIGVYVSAGSACNAGSGEISRVIRALNVDAKKYGVIRFSFGLNTSNEDINYLFKYLPKILTKLRNE